MHTVLLKQKAVRIFEIEKVKLGSWVKVNETNSMKQTESFLRRQVLSY
jgi:hypothetical protein